MKGKATTPALRTVKNMLRLEKERVEADGIKLWVID
jgi:hypothetical protein